MSHRMPSDFNLALQSNSKAQIAWDGITPKARNEWICWIISVKQDITRVKHITRACSDLAAGKRRPCCWIGCTHRADKPISPWVLKAIIDKKASSKI